MNLFALLAEKGVIDTVRIENYEQLAQERGVSYETVLVEEGIEPEAIRKALGEYFDVPTHTVDENQEVDPKVLRYIPEDSARHYGILPLRVVDGVLEVGVTDPEDYSVRDALNFITAKNQVPYRFILILEHDLKIGLHWYENLTGEVDEALVELETEITEEEEEKAAQKAVETKEEEIEHIQEDAPVVKIVATILRYAVDGGASDIHIEPTETKVQVRFRVDGVLQTSLELPKKVHLAVIARTKIMSSLRLDEKRKPQDGRFSAKIDKRKIDFRVSILPTNFGEKVVLRILDTEGGVRSLESTGVSQHNIELIRKAIEQPYGIILISGPTGSGKSTTLYAMLSEVDTMGKNVMSLEDPVEYNIEGVSQSQIKPEIGYTFASGLRTALRQDPDIIMVGEIRDKETAQLAIQAALTGHLVLSTIHTNNAVGVIPRLIDMGVDPFLIAPTLQLALAQRLVRRICENTGKKTSIEGSLKVMIDSEFEGIPESFRPHLPETDHVLFVEPTPECTSGTKGRVAVMEAVEINDELEKLILNNGTEEEMTAAARKNGFVTMKEDAMIKALEHTIPFEEVSTLGGELLVSDEAEAEEQELHEETVDNQVPEKE